MKINIDVPDGKSGIWEVKTFIVPKGKCDEIEIFKEKRGIPFGTYKKLTRNGIPVMSNTPDEINDFIPFVSKAKGNILINGLGLGTIIKILLTKKEVNKITIVENSKDVINLVAPAYSQDGINIINDNAFDFTPKKNEKYDYIWHDIWDRIDPKNLKEMNILKNKYAYMDAYQECWAENVCKKIQQTNNWNILI